MVEGSSAFSGSPFGNVFDLGSSPVEEQTFSSLRMEKKVRNLEADALDLWKRSLKLKRLSRLRNGDTPPSIVSRKIKEMSSKIINSLTSLIQQAISMAMFKFVIELCAMVIKTVIEAMSGLKLRVPNIDTPGVYYNGSAAATPPVGTAGAAQSQRYDDPFKSMFPSSGMAAW